MGRIGAPPGGPGEVYSEACRLSWAQDEVVGMSCGYEASKIEDLIIQTGEACRDPKRPGMSDRDTVVPRGVP